MQIELRADLSTLFVALKLSNIDLAKIGWVYDTKLENR